MLTLAWTLGCVVALLYAIATDDRRLRAMFKCGATGGFLALAIQWGAPWGDGASRAIFVGLACGAVGDVLLLGEHKRALLAGLTFFLLGHLAYGLAFLEIGVSWPSVGVAWIPTGGMLWLFWRWAGPHLGKLRGAVAAYLVVIGWMVCTAVGMVALEGSPRGRALLAGAVLFAASDVFVARQRFVSPGKVNRYFGLPLYYLAQVVFAFWAV